MSNDNGLAVIEHVSGTALEMYQDRNEVRELTDRLLSLHPAAGEVGKPGMIAVAQLALLVGASPLPGTNEIHVWKSGNKIQFQLGINFYRRKADERGGVLWEIQPRQMRDDERAEYGVPQGQIAAICKAAKRADMEKYIGLGFKANQIWDMVGRAGIGTAGQGEGKAGRTAVWTALKRCEVDLYRALFPALMQQIENAQRGTGDNITISAGPEWKEFSPEEVDDMFSYSASPTAPAAVEYIDLDTGEIEEAEYEEMPGDESVDTAVHEEIVARLRGAVHPNKTAVASDKQLKFLHSGLSRIFTSETDKKSVLAAIFPELLENDEISTKRMTIGQASAIVDWLGAKPPEYNVDEQAANEAQVILRAALVAQGQMPLAF